MAASISTLTGFSGWTGKFHLAVRRLARLPPREGVNGEAWVFDGWTTDPDKISTRYIAADQTAADTHIATARALQDGATYTAVDPEGRSWSIKVLSVRPDTAERPNGGVLVMLDWLCQVEAAP